MGVVRSFGKGYDPKDPKLCGVQHELQDTLRSSASCGGGEGPISSPSHSAWGLPCLPGSPNPPLFLLGERGGEDLSFPFPLLPQLPLPSPSHSWAPCVSGWSAGHWAARGLSWCILPLAPSPPSLPSNPILSCPHQSTATQPSPAGLAGPFPGRAGPQWKVVEKCGQISDLQHSGKEFIAIV